VIYIATRLLLCFLLSVLASTFVIRVLLRRPAPPGDEPHAGHGFWIGFLETIFVFVFVIEREYAGLAILVAAKQFLAHRKDATAGARSHYHLASLINMAVAVIFALIARFWISQVFWAILA
jgi:hypothetical protein